MSFEIAREYIIFISFISIITDLYLDQRSIYAGMCND